MSVEENQFPASSGVCIRLWRPIPGATMPLKQLIRQVERFYLLQALEQAGGNRSQASRLLAMKRTTLIMKLKVLGLQSHLKG